MAAFYNEYDPKAAAWLRELIKAGLIADGEVDERDLWDISPADLRGFSQVHLCAGIGVWSYALRKAGWSDDRAVWTGSFPCQPFSAAGKGEGFADERHLWPAGEHLIRQCRPGVLFGEQVANKTAGPWLDLIQTDLEALGYAFGACAFPSASIGAPHIRDRTYWMAESSDERHERAGVARGRRDGPADHSAIVGMADTDEAGGLAIADDTERRADATGRHVSDGQDAGRSQGAGDVEGRSEHGGMADADGERQPEQHVRLRQGRATPDVLEVAGGGSPDGAGGERADGSDAGSLHPTAPAGPTNGRWAASDWLLCRDGKWRPVESGTFPLVASTSGGVGRSRDPSDAIDPYSGEARVTRLKGYGNAINAAQAQIFIEAAMN
ncbi:MAG: DNA cytosine methyltransferase [Devosia sp.]